MDIYETQLEGKQVESCMKYNRSVYQALTLITQFSINMLVPIFLCSFLGIYLDKKFNTGFLVIILFFVGALAGFTNVYKLARKIYDNREVDDEDEDQRRR